MRHFATTHFKDFIMSKYSIKEDNICSVCGDKLRDHRSVLEHLANKHKVLASIIPNKNGLVVKNLQVKCISRKWTLNEGFILNN